MSYDDNQLVPGEVVERFKYEITYDAEGRLLEVAAYSNDNDDVPATWTPYETQTFSYDSEGNLQELLFDNDPNDGHDGDSKMVVVRSGSTISEVRRWDYDDASGQLELIGYLDVDTSNGLVTGYDYYSNTGTSDIPAWTSDNRRDRFSYDGSGRLISELTEKNNGGAWIKTWEQTYNFYDSGWLSTDTDTDYYDDGRFDYSTQVNYLLDPSTGLPISYTRERDTDGTGYVSDSYSYTITWEEQPMSDSFRQLDFAHSFFDIPDSSIWVRRIAEPIDK